MIGLSWNEELMTADLDVGASGIATDASLKTAVVISLFTDRRARSDDPLPALDGDRRGWVGDALSDVPDDLIGSRLWLLAREKQTEETRRRAEEYAREALTWLLAEKVATDITVTAEWRARGWLGLAIAIRLRKGGIENFQFAAEIGNSEAGAA